MKRIIIIISSLAAVLSFSSTSYAGITASDPTNAFSTVKNPVLENPLPTWGSVKKPYPTAAWYSNFGIRGAEDPNTHKKEQPGLQPLFPLPYTIKSYENGLGFGVPGATTTDVDKYGVFSQLYAFTNQFELATDPMETLERRLTDAGELAATIRYERNKEEYMYAPIVRGAPYITMFYHQLTPVLKAGNVQTVNGLNPDPNTPITGKRFQVISAIPGGTQTWIVYSESPLTLRWNNPGTGWKLIAMTPYTGWIRVALLDDTKENIHNDATLLDKYADNIPIDGKVNYQYDNDSASITFKWETINHQPPLMMTLPHQRQTLTSPSTTDKIKMRTHKGEMLGIIGSTWKMDEPFAKITFLELHDANVLPVKQKEAIVEALTIDAANVNATLNPKEFAVYTSGKHFARAARLALIAEQFNQNDIKEKLVGSLEANLTSWIQGKNKWKLNYDTTWGGIIPAIDDFGSQYYNDHHFHYGYFIYTIATIAKLDPTWLSKPIAVNGTEITPLEWAKVLIRDYANPLQDDPYFPYSRHADAFDGRSFASGLPVAFGDGRNQESVSEAVNAYYAIVLLAKTINDPALENWGNLLLARELRAAHTYWQIAKDSDIYAPDFAKDNKITAILFDGKTDRHTFFMCKDSDNIALECTYGIEMMPFTAITTQLLKKPWIDEFYGDMTKVYNSSVNDNPAWSLILLKGRIMGAPTSAYNDLWNIAVKSKNENTYDDGDSKTNTLYVIGAQGKR